MKNSKRFLSLFLAVVLCFNLGGAITSASATNSSLLSEEQMLALADALSGVEVQKEMICLDDVDFSSLQLGNPIQTYVYINETFEPGYMLYPIMSHTDLVLWAVNLDGQFQLTTALVSEVNSLVDTGKSFALVYDQDSAYLYMDGTFFLLKASVLDNPSRSVLDPNMPCDTLQTTALEGKDFLPHDRQITRAQRYFSCNVKVTLQTPYDSLCWAAVTACISNYLYGTNLTAEKVAQKYHGSIIDFNKYVLDQNVQGVLDTYDIPYSYRLNVPSDDIILNNIKNNYPLYSNWRYAIEGKHANCIYATDIMNGYIYIMDPLVGFISVPPSSSGGYSYVQSGDTLTLYAAGCRYWR